MILYIKVENGQPVGHPYFLDNLMHYYGGLPSDHEPFYRIAAPKDLVANTFQKIVSTYVKGFDGSVWTDSYSVVDMTEEEKQELINEMQSNPPGPNITLNTSTGRWIPTIPEPDDGKLHHWDFESGSWISYISLSDGTANT
jgi:hypothetical protein